MIIYNLTIHVSHAVHQDWLRWQEEENIPAIMDCGQFSEYRLFHLLEQDESEGITYVIQYIAAGMEDYERYIADYASGFRKNAEKRWQGRK